MAGPKKAPVPEHQGHGGPQGHAGREQPEHDEGTPPMYWKPHVFKDGIASQVRMRTFSFYTKYICTSLYGIIIIIIHYSKSYTVYLYASRAWASRVTKVSRGGTTYKDKGEPIGTAADRLAGTCVDCVISEKSLSLTCLNS